MSKDPGKKRAYLRYFRKHKKKHGTAKGAQSYSRYLQTHEPGSAQTRRQMGGLSSSDYAAIRKMRKK